ncbi:MAG: hypothetical protein ACK46X_22035 [Candidatus Sericytochromatia bacterium]
MLAAVAGLAISGCSAGAPMTPGAGTSSTTTTGVTSAPGRLKGALALAMRHLDVQPRAASNPFHLVGFKGKGLNEGSTVVAPDSAWEFTFSRYAEGEVSQKYDIVTVSVPGAGATTMTASVSTDATLSPIENWDAALDGNSPDSNELLAPLKAQGVATLGAMLTLSQGKVKAEAGGKSVVYDTAESKYEPVQ